MTTDGPALATVTCPRCLGHLKDTPTSGVWRCGSCQATLIVGRQVAIRHVPGKLMPPENEQWPHLEHQKAEAYKP